MPDPAQVTALCAMDPRIPAKCREFFPDSPEFADWLANRVTGFGASLEFAQILCSTLRQTFPKAVVPAEAVVRLAVDDNQEAIGRINRTYRGLAFAIPGMVFQTRIKGTIEVPPGATSIDDLLVRRRSAIDVSHDKIMAYLRVWHCAYGMLAGVRIDPRIAKPKRKRKINQTRT